MKSMTGFGKQTIQNENYQLDVEIKSVNQRFLDIQFRMPKEANPYEASLRQLIKATLQRGRVEVYVNLSKLGQNQKEVRVHWELVDQLLQEIQGHLGEHYPTSSFDAATTVNHLLKQSDFVEVSEKVTANELLEPLLVEAVNEAIQQLDSSRLQEGMQIQQVLMDYGTTFTTYIQELADFVAVFEADYRARFEGKLTEWLGEQVDEARLLTEMAILLERGDVHEELDRLVIHTEKLMTLLQTPTPVGRELDFLIQEMNREVNTIGSKSSPIEIKNRVVQMKTLLEKIREQIQNVE